jgi:small conductance mechanosensitive channel
MPYSLPMSIGLTVILVLLLALFYLLINKKTKQTEGKFNGWLLFLLYFLLFIVVVIALAYGTYIWGFDLVAYLLDLWDKIGSFLLDKVGAIISTIVVFLVAGFIIRIFKMLVAKSQERIRVTNEKRKHTIVKITSSIVNYVIKIAALLAILAVWGINVLPALAGLGILGLVVGLGAQDLIKDIIAGFFIVFEKHFDVGDKVEVGGFKGEVIDVGLKTTRIMNWKKDVKIYNNASLVNIINYSVAESMAVVEFGIAYESDIDKTLDILKEALPKLRDSIPELLEDPVCLGVAELAGSSINMRVIARTKTEQHYGVERVLRKEIKKILDANDIEIPFPQVVVHQAKK